MFDNKLTFKYQSSYISIKVFGMFIKRSWYNFIDRESEAII